MDIFYIFYITISVSVTAKNIEIDRKSTMFTNKQIIFSSNFNITRILVPTDGSNYIRKDSIDLPSIFFTISDPSLEGGSCVYVLEDLAAYEILEGGRDTTSDYSGNTAVYFGAKDGIYKYDSDTLSAKKYGPFRDNVIQLQKANGIDLIYFLDSNYKIFKLEVGGTIKTRVNEVICAKEFVLDTVNNLYYVSCDDGLPRVVIDGNLAASVTEDWKNVKLLRPAYIMHACVPIFTDGILHILHSNGTIEKKDLILNEKPSAYSIDAGLYLVAAMNGRIYEFNVMELLLKSMFGIVTEWPNDVTKIVMSIIDNVKEGINK